MRVDVHQHAWTERLCAALARRAEPPRLRPGGDGMVLELAGEPPFALPAQPDDPRAHAERLGDLGLDRALVALSSALGIETLPDAQAREVIAAWDEDADAFPAALRAWGAVPLQDPDPDDVDAALERGRVGISLPATELGSPGALDRVAPLLARLAERDAPLFVHPGPAPAGTWAAAITAYPAAMAAAWNAWAVHGRPRHATLRVVFAALAGLAPLHTERLAARGFPAAARSARDDDLTFLDTSSYGPLAIDAAVSAVGAGALVHGSDLPYAEPAEIADPALRRAVLEDNPARLLAGHPARLLTFDPALEALA